MQNSKKIIDPQKINDARLEKKVFIGLDKENEGKFYIILYYIILYYIKKRAVLGTGIIHYTQAPSPLREGGWGGEKKNLYKNLPNIN